MSALSPGLYRATVGGEADVIVMVSDDEIGLTMTAVGTPGLGAHGLDSITDAIPLVVLDLHDWSPSRPTTASEALRGSSLFRTGNGDYVSDILNQIERQIQPARIPEPGLWGVVEASTTEHKRCVFIRDTGGDGASWITPYFFPRDSTRRAVGWSDLIDPVLVREGVES